MNTAKTVKTFTKNKLFFMVALWNRVDYYIFILSFVLSIFLLHFFLT